MTSAHELLSFWFDEQTRKRWFEPTQGFDDEVRRRYAELLAEAGDDRLRGWEATPDGALALCILLDQLPRNMYRGTPLAFAFDARARAVAERALASGHDAAVPVERRMFLYLPFEHSEDLDDQERSVELFRALGDAELLTYAELHRDIIARFGRFPHRNRILGRSTTAEEGEFLQGPNSAF